MRARHVFLCLSVAANFWVFARLSRSAHPPPVPTQVENAAPAAAPVWKKTKGRGSIQSEPANGPTAPFSWAELESADYKDYIARLRSFGVPEGVIRDIIIADVAKLYRPRLAALRTKPDETKFWKGNANLMNANSTPAQRQQIAALQREQSELIRTLLGKNVYEEIAAANGYARDKDPFYGSMTEEQRDRFQDLERRQSEMVSEIYTKAGNYVDRETQLEINAVKKKYRDEMAGFLSPEQIEQYQLRFSDVASNMRYQLSYFEPNEAEFRAVFKYKQALEEADTAIDPATLRQDPAEMQARLAKRRELETALADSLGPDRAKELKMAEDYSTRSLFEAGLPKESVYKIAGLKSDAESAANKVRMDRTLNPDQRNEALAAIKAAVENELTGVLGEKRSKAYAGSSGYWLRNLAPIQTKEINRYNN